MSVVEFFSQPVWHRLSLTLVHFLWQGLTVAVIAYAAVRVLRLKRGDPRYEAYLLTFALMAICPLLTFAVLGGPTRPAPIAPAPMPEIASPGPVPRSALPEPSQRVSEDTLTAGPTDGTPLRARLDGMLQAALPWALVGWMGGVLILSVRLLLGFVGVRRWRRHLEPLSDGLSARIAPLSKRLGIPGFSRIFASHHAREAVAMGCLRPMVLLPATMLTAMDPAMIEAVVAHELAHIRRFDLWINLAQRVVETLLFYHPAVWWLSGRLRSERELCCDELAVEATGERVTYASALENARRAQLAVKQPALGLGIRQDRRSTLGRVRHILGLSPNPPDSRSWLAGAIVVLLMAFLTVPTALVLTAEAQDKTTASPPPAPTARDKAIATAALFQAIKDKNIEKMRLAIDQGADLEGKNKNAIWLKNDIQLPGCTPLYVAAGVPADRDVINDSIRLLLEAGANPNTRAPNGQIPLHFPAYQGAISSVEMLVSAGSDVNAADKEGRTPAIIAFELGHYDTFDLLVGKGATVSTDLMSAYKGDLSRVRSLIKNGKAQERLEQDLTLLHAAAAGGHTAIVELLLTNGLDVRSETQEGYTALHYAVARNHREMAELLLAKGANVNTEPGKQTPLHWAISRQHREMIEWLVAKGANPNADGGDYWGTPLHWAVWWRDVDTALLLVSHGGDIHFRTQKYPYSPLFDTVVHGNPAMAEALVTEAGDTRASEWAPLLATVVSGNRQATEDLLAKGADVNAKGEMGLRPLHLAAREGHRAIAELLIERGADVNAKSENTRWDPGMTALHSACAGGRKSVAELLIAKGADVNAKSKNGYTPLHMASTEGYRDVAELLIASGADVNARNDYGRPPLSYAKSRSRTEIIELLQKHGTKE